jgi:hypothetical protein
VQSDRDAAPHGWLAASLIGDVSAVLGVRLETVGSLLRIHDGDSFTDV